MTTANDQLLKAASGVNEDVAGVSRALEQGADVNAKDEGNNTALNLASQAGHAEVIKRLLAAGADVENKDSGLGLTPLAYAAVHEHYEVAQLLLAHGARVTDDLLSVVQTKVNILEENCENGMVTEEGVNHWKGILNFFVTQRIKQDLPGVVPRLVSAGPAERRDAVAQVEEAAKRGLDIALAAPHLPALLSDADPDTRVAAARALTFHLACAGQWPSVGELLSSADARLRLAAVEAVAEAGQADDSLIQPLSLLLRDGDSEVRTEAAMAVATLPRKGVDAKSLLPAMIELLADASPAVRRGSAFAFWMWNNNGLREYCSPAIPALRSLAEHEENQTARQFAARVVAEADAAP